MKKLLGKLLLTVVASASLLSICGSASADQWSNNSYRNSHHNDRHADRDHRKDHRDRDRQRDHRKDERRDHRNHQ